MMRKAAAAILTGMIIAASPVHTAADDAYIAPVRMRITCYTVPEGAVTASGQTVREGCCAAKRSWIGKTAVLYDSNMNLIGVYEITDTGDHQRIRSGQSIDLYKSSLDRCYEHIAQHGDYGYVQILEASG